MNTNGIYYIICAIICFTAVYFGYQHYTISSNVSGVVGIQFTNDGVVAAGITKNKNNFPVTVDIEFSFLDEYGNEIDSNNKTISIDANSEASYISAPADFSSYIIPYRVESTILDVHKQ